jgi:pimeloyl-ACP methyl ester carboxylesterase
LRENEGLTRDDILDNITIAWLTNTALSGANKLDKGGHFAAWEQPQLLSEEVRAGFRSLRK